MCVFSLLSNNVFSYVVSELNGQSKELKIQLVNDGQAEESKEKYRNVLTSVWYPCYPQW